MVAKKLLSLLMFGVVCHCSWSIAEDDGRYYGLEPREKFEIRLGAFLADDYDTSLRLDSNRFILGGLIDFEDDLNLDANDSAWRVDGFYRFNERHRMSFNVYSSRRDGKTSIDRGLSIGAPGGLPGFEFPLNAQVSSKMDYDLVRLGYDYSFINRRKFEAMVGTGVNFRHLDVEAAYQINVGDRKRGQAFGAEEWLPLPVVGMGGRWNFTDKLQANIRFDLFYLQFDNYEGYYQEALLNLEHNTFEHFGFGLGLNFGDLNLRGREDDIRGEFDSRTQALVGYMKYYF
ncbi:MAG: hypothetical protein ABJL54_10450 [Halioglobus sp.]